MASTWSALKIELLETGANSGTWGTATNVNLGDAILGEAITGQATVDFASDADVTITLTDSATSQAARNLRLNITESSTGVGSVRNLILGSGCQIEKFYLINNTGTGAKTVKNTSGTGISVPAGKATLVYNNGTNVVDAASYFTSLTLGSALPVASGGTSLTTLTANNVILGNGTSAPLFVAPSSSGNVLTSNGSTWASSAPAAGGITYTTVKTANYTAVANDGVQTNTTAGAFTVTLPATPANGDQVFVVDSFNTWGTNNLTIGRNGSTIEGIAQDLVCDITGVSVQCVYNGTTWDIFAQVGGAGGSVVTGPASSTDNAFTRFDGTTGKIIQNSTGATLSDTGAAIFTGALDVLGDSTAGSNLKLYEDTDNGTNFVSLKAPNTIAADVTFTLPSADGTNAQVLQTNGSGVLSFATVSASQWTTSSSDIYYNSGNVGIGTSTAPTARLSATGTTTGFGTALINIRAMQNDGTTLGTPIVLAGHRYLGSQDNNSGVIDVPSSTGRMALSVNSTVMAAYNTTQMGIGANSFGELSHRLAVIALNDLGIEVNCGSATATPMTFRSGGTNRGTITTTSGGTAYNTTSDYRLKENIQTMQNALATVSALKPVTYKWKADNSNGQGFIAHELAEVCPQAVTGQKDAVDANGNPQYQGIDTSFLVATLTSAIQEQQALITTLAERITALEGV